MTTTTATPLAPLVEVLCSQIRQLPPVQRVGAVTGVAGLIIESDGPNVGLGELCLIRSARDNFSVQAEVVGFREHRVLLMPLGGMAGLHVGCEVAACAHPPLPPTARCAPLRLQPALTTAHLLFVPPRRPRERPQKPAVGTAGVVAGTAGRAAA